MRFLALQRLLIALWGIASIISCQAFSDLPAQQTLQPKVIINETLGPTLPSGQAAVWLTSLNDLRNAWPELAVSTPLRGSDLILNEFDFGSKGLLLISMGEMPTGGYSLSLRPKESELKDGVARIAVKWNKPERGRMVVQMLTRPCLLIQLPKGRFKQIDIIDEKNSRRARVTL